MKLDDPNRDELLTQKKIQERYLARMQIQLVRAGTNAPKSLREEIDKV